MAIGTYANLGNRAVIDVGGDDALSFLQGLITNDMEHVSETQAIYAALLTPQGRFLHDFFIIEYLGRFMVDIDAQHAAAFIKRLNLYKLRARVEISDITSHWAVCAIIPENKQIQIATDLDKGPIFQDPRHEKLGLRAIVAKGNDYWAELKEISELEYDSLRISLCIPTTGHELIPEKSFLLDYGFEELKGVDFDKGCYVGQEVIARMKHRSLVKRRLFLIETSVELNAANQTEIMSDEIIAGEVLSVSTNHATALLRLDLVAKGGLTIGGTPITPKLPAWVKHCAP